VAHVALYREFRPQGFAEVVGQEHVTRTLRNALSQGRLHHAYLFSGPRGTGKTSVARILAKAVNCQNSSEGEPCNECAACSGITSGQTLDVIEIDAASNRNIDDIRDLREKVKYSPTDLRYKVYIIDEVHMLTEFAFNALLKTLEEPPGHVLFVLATTDPHKVPITITSRCQRFDFHRLTSRQITAQMQTVCEAYNVSITDEALAAIARHSEGGMRDALSLLEQTIAFAGGREITLADTLTVLGAAPLEQFLQLDDHLVSGQVGEVLSLLHEMVRQGKDLRQFVRDYLAHLRDLLILQIDPNGAVLDLQAQTRELLQKRSGQFAYPRLLAAIRVLAQLEADLRFAPSPRLLVEVALIRLCGSEQGDQTVPPAPSPTRSPARQAPEAKVTAEPTATRPHPEAPTGAGVDRVVEAWPDVLELIKQKQRSTRALLEHARVGALRGSTLLLKTGAAFVDLINLPQHKGIIEKAMIKVGLPVSEVRAVREDEDSPGNGGEGEADSEPAQKAETGDLAARAQQVFGAEVVKVIKEDDPR
jgi:DNA polymerase III subunit gamma/tau